MDHKGVRQGSEGQVTMETELLCHNVGTFFPCSSSPPVTICLKSLMRSLILSLYFLSIALCAVLRSGPNGVGRAVARWRGSFSPGMSPRLDGTTTEELEVLVLVLTVLDAWVTTGGMSSAGRGGEGGRVRLGRVQLGRGGCGWGREGEFGEGRVRLGRVWLGRGGCSWGGESEVACVVRYEDFTSADLTATLDITLV